MRLSRPQIVYYTAFASDFAYFAFVFAITRLLADTGGSQWQLGIFGAASSASYAFSGPLAGVISDRWGRRRVILTGVLGLIGVLALCSLWPSRKLFYVMGAAGGVVVAFIYPPMIAWLTEDATETSQRLFRFCLSWNAGVICSQMVGGWLFSIRPALPMVAGIVVMAGVLPLLPSPRAARGSPATAPSHPAGAGPGSARAMTFVYLGWLANVGGALAFSLIVHLFPYVAHESGIAPPVHGAMLAGNRLAAVATYVLMYRFPFWQYRLWTALVPQLCAMAGLLLIAFGHSVAILAAGLVLAAFMLGYNYFAGIYYSTVAFGSERKGMASGMHEATLAVGGGVGALGGGLLGSLYGSRAPYKLCVATMLVFVALEIAIYVRSRRAPTAAGAAVG